MHMYKYTLNTYTYNAHMHMYKHTLNMYTYNACARLPGILTPSFTQIQSSEFTLNLDEPKSRHERNETS